MKFFALIAVLCVAFALAACGGNDSSADSGAAEERSQPVIEPPEGPPPTELIVKEVEEGTGPAATKGDELTIHYVGVDEEGTVRYSNWSDVRPLTFTLGRSEFFEGWDEALEGMKVGGRRELAFPAIMAGEPRFYVVDLLKIE